MTELNDNEFVGITITDTDQLNDTEKNNNELSINDIESNIVQNNNTQTSSKNNMYIKLIISIFITLVLSPFPICDIYFALTDNSCLTQNSQNLKIILKSYLLASGIISIVCLAIFNFTVCIVDFNFIKINEKNYIYSFIYYICDKILLYFQIAWLILGCYLFWGYIDLFNCSQQVHDYLFTRFILGIIVTSIKMRESFYEKK